MKAYGLLERLEDLRGCAVVHVDRERGLVTFWAGGLFFLEFVTGLGDELREFDAWRVAEVPSTLQDAVAASRRHYGLDPD